MSERCEGVTHWSCLSWHKHRGMHFSEQDQGNSPSHPGHCQNIQLSPSLSPSLSLPSLSLSLSVNSLTGAYSLLHVCLPISAALPLAGSWPHTKVEGHGSSFSHTTPELYQSSEVCVCVCVRERESVCEYRVREREGESVSVVSVSSPGTWHWL